jgi:hypothetical protein
LVSNFLSKALKIGFDLWLREPPSILVNGNICIDLAKLNLILFRD